jgi:hypothetical protein
MSMALPSLGVVFRQRCRIFQEHAAEFYGRFMGVDRAPEPSFHEKGNTAGMVDVSVAEDDRVDAGRVEGKWLAVDGFVFRPALHESAVEENGSASSPENVARARYTTGRPVEFKFHVALPFTVLVKILSS